MKKFIFSRKQTLPISITTAWSFFSDPRNLAKITPSTLDFQIKSNVPDVMTSGLIIEYTVKPLLGIPMTWVSKINDVNEPYSFVDEQIQGPYAYWHHLHCFAEVQGGIEATDTVTYAVPFGILGEWVRPFIVEPKLNEIFEYRSKVLQELFPSARV